MEGSRKLSLKTREIIEQEPELKYKNCFTITNDRFREAIVLYYRVNNYFCKS